ncbi:MAG: butyrate kinase [Rikenellaceae bacterium]|nr:butyrate kinase [Rikenellaceae bacterium]
MKKYLILAINPGSTSSKIAVYGNEEQLFEKTIRHSSEEISSFPDVASQFGFRKELILKTLTDEGFDIRTLDAVVGRGGILKPVSSGVYEINDAILRDLREAKNGEHASNLGALIADDIAKGIDGARAFIADPVVVDELQDVARVTGHPLFKRTKVFHALNQKEVARSYAESVSKNYEDLNLIVAHLGGGISVGAHRNGRIIDVNNAIDGEGAFSPERSGKLPALQVAELCFSGKYTYQQIKKMLVGEGGVVAHLGTNDMMPVRKMAREGDAKYKLIVDAMHYNIGKEIGSMAAVLHGKVDAILITGGMAHSAMTTDAIREMVEFIAPVVIFPGEDELGALAMNGLRVLRGEAEPKEYS